MSRIQQLWSFNRYEYIMTPRNKEECVFCNIPNLSDKDGLIIARGQYSYVCLNLYPYNFGHLLIVPFTHFNDYSILNKSTVYEISDFTQHSINILKQLYNSIGFNIGFNQGYSSGAGIPEHLHEHVVPRYDGDTNFTAVISDLKIISEDLNITLDKIRNLW